MLEQCGSLEGKRVLPFLNGYNTETVVLNKSFN